MVATKKPLLKFSRGFFLHIVRLTDLRLADVLQDSVNDSDCGCNEHRPLRRHISCIAGLRKYWHDDGQYCRNDVKQRSLIHLYHPLSLAYNSNGRARRARITPHSEAKRADPQLSQIYPVTIIGLVKGPAKVKAIPVWPNQQLPLSSLPCHLTYSPLLDAVQLHQGPLLPVSAAPCL